MIFEVYFDTLTMKQNEDINTAIAQARADGERAGRAAALEEAASHCDRLVVTLEHPTEKDCSTKNGALWYGRKQGAMAAASAIRALIEVKA